MNFQSLAPYVNYIFGLFILTLILYLKTFISEKAKIKVLLENTSRLTEEKELVTSKFQKEIESIKKEHDLDIAKRKYIYESKMNAYNKFLTFFR